MSKNSDMPGHTWKIVGGVEKVNGVSHFIYFCTKCPAKAYNGIPLEPPYDKECTNAVQIR